MYKLVMKNMPEDAHSTLQGTLNLLEVLQNSPDDAVYTNKSHMNLLKNVNTLLGIGDEITSFDAEKVLKVCLQYKHDMGCAPCVLSIISTLISIDKAKPFDPSLDFLPSALAVLDILKKCAEDRINHIRTLSFQVLIAHPTSTLIKLVACHCAQLIETFGLFFSVRVGCTENNTEPFILLELLNILPTHEKSMFIEEGIPLWLSGILPCLMQILVSIDNKEKTETCLAYTEALTEQLILHDYFDYPEWESVLESTVDRIEYPGLIKSLLENGKDSWFRIWIVLVKLLKSQVTKSYGSYGTPINSLLPVVEAAFKKDSIQRVRAFECWNELILNFSNETNPTCIEKRVKLVIIPLRLNNAKTEDTIIAKFNTWWLLIRRFKPKLDKFANEILVPFLHFIFGKKKTPKQYFWAGQVSNNMRNKCLEAFLEIVRHTNCSDCCTSTIEPLNGKVITTVMLADYWSDWVYSLKTAVHIVVLLNTSVARKKMKCIWKSFILLMTELQDNSVRRDWFDDLINLLSELSKDTAIYSNMANVLLEDLIVSLFEDHEVRTLLSSRSHDHRPTQMILAIITDKVFNSYYKRTEPKDLQETLLLPVATLVSEMAASPAYMICLLDDLPLTVGAFKLWTALARKASETDLCPLVLSALLRWPFKTLLVMSDVKDAALAWYTLYNTQHVKLGTIEFDNDICNVLTKHADDRNAANYFILFALIGILKHKPDKSRMAKLETLTYEMHDHQEFEPLIAALVDTLALLIGYSATPEYENLAQRTINCIKNVLKLIDCATIENYSPSISRSTFSEVNANLLSINKTILTETLVAAMKKYLTNSTNESLKEEVKKIILSLEYSSVQPTTESPKKDVAKKGFVLPKVQEVKKAKKKGPSIVNTVVENGEEYVVVKSNWKFNPKTLTENQKEKLQRKRDIPALYQDLSQSQDEFKLSTWKTDSNSQDTSLSSSKSSKSAYNTNESDVLKNMPSTDVVPKIMENILDNAKTTQQKTDVISPAPIIKLSKTEKVVSPQGTKSPRMALKDRVFRNVRNLIEKSSPPKLKDEEHLNKLDNVCNSPTLKPNIDVTANKDDLGQINISNSPMSKANCKVSKTSIRKAMDEDKVEIRQENQNPVAANTLEGNKNKLIIVTPKNNDQNIMLVCTPIKNPKNDNKITNPAPLLSAERPARVKRKPKKYDDSLLLAFKKSLHSKNKCSQDSQDQDVLPDITIAEVHTLKDKNDNTDIDQAPKATEQIEPKNKDDKNKTQTDDVTVVSNDYIINCDVLKENETIQSHKSENVLITPTTPISNKAPEKSPEKPYTTVEVPSEKDKASEGMKNNATKIILESYNEEIPTVKTPSNKLKQFSHQISLIKEKQNDTNKKVDISTTPLIKTRKSKYLCKNSATPELNVYDVNVKEKSITDNEQKIKKSITNFNDKKMECNVVIELEDVKRKLIKKSAVVQKTNEVSSKLESLTPTDKTNEINSLISAVKSGEQQAENKNEDIVPVTQKNKTKEKKELSVNKGKKSRIEKELMIDTVEGHPFLKSQSEKRLTRKNNVETEISCRRKSLAEKLHKSKLEATPKTSRKWKEKKSSPTNTVTVEESQDKQNNSEDSVMYEPPYSEDIIESSQDSTMTTISVKSTKRTPKNQPVVVLEKIVIHTTETQDLIQDSEMVDVPNEETLEKTDIELSQNKTAEVVKNTTDLTENMDTEPINENNYHMDIDIDIDRHYDDDNDADIKDIDIDRHYDDDNDADIKTTLIGRNSGPVFGPETQELAEADTQPINPKDFKHEDFVILDRCQPLCLGSESDTSLDKAPAKKDLENEPAIDIIDKDITQSLPEVTSTNIDDTNDVSSPYKNDNLRKQDFLNNTLEISPIKVQSPDREKKSPSPETSSDFVVIKLSSPVHSNGEPFEKHGSPEFFTEDKRDLSPPRAVIVKNTHTSPSSSLSLKKNRAQVRPTGRAAQMLDLLCVNSDLKNTKVDRVDRAETEEMKKASASTPVRRNLRVLYNTVGDSEMPEQNVEETEHFLKLTRTLPAVTCSPSGSILKRKLINIADEATANKRKRVSFQDPVSKSVICVQKYLEPPSIIRSPQSSAKKKAERQARTLKSPKRLEIEFNLASVLSKTVESFTETATATDDTQSTSLDFTPVVEIVKTSELNDTDPFYPDLVDCKEPIQVIATELSSPVMVELFIKEMEGKVETIGDLAKMTELEINRLCIKAPKIQVAKKVLTEYAAKRPAFELVETVIEEAFSEPMTESLLDEKKVSVEMQTDVVHLSSAEIQTDTALAIVAFTQTENAVTAHSSMQTDESGAMDILSTCLAEKDFIGKLTEKLDEESIKTIAEKLPTQSVLDLLIEKCGGTNTVFGKLSELQSLSLSKDRTSNAELSVIGDILCKTYDSSDLALLCSQLLQKIYCTLRDVPDKPAQI